MRKARTTILGLIATSLLAAGCANNEQKPITITQLDPYTSPGPGNFRRLPAGPVAKPAPVAVGAQAGWIPRIGIDGARWKYVVVHHSASDRSSPQSMADYHVKVRGWDALGYHFVIGNGIGYPDGSVFVGERWTKQMHGAHCKTPDNIYNNNGVGICLIGNLDNHRPTQKQVASLAKLISFLSGKCRIPRGNIKTHGGITHKTECPGRYFSLQPVLQQLTTRTASAIP